MKNPVKNFYFLVFVLFATSACFDSDNHNNEDVDLTPPVFGHLDDVTIVADTQGHMLAFTVEDDGPVPIQVSAVSTNSAIISDDGFEISGSSSERTLSITPVADTTGTAEIVLSATDSAGNLATEWIVVSVILWEVNARELIDEIVSLDMDAEPLFINQLVVIDDLDQETGFDELVD